MSERPLIVAKIPSALELFIVESSSAIAKKTVPYCSSIRHRSPSSSCLIRFASLELAYTGAIRLEIMVRKSFAASVPLILASPIALAL